MKRCALLVALVATLCIAACGGGGDDGRETTQPVDCNARPELCK